MDRLKPWVALTAVAVLTVLAAGWFLLVSPQRAAADDLRVQAEDQARTNASLSTQLDVLEAQAARVDEQEKKLKTVLAKLPETPALTPLLRALTAAASTSGVELISVTPGTATATTGTGAAGGAATGAAPTAAPAPAAGGASAAPVAGAAAPAATATATATATQTLSTIPVEINVVGDFAGVQRYLTALEDLPRALRVTSLDLAPGDNPVDPAATTGAATTPEDGSVLAGVVSAEVYVSGPVAAPAAPAAGGAGAAGAPATPATPPAATGPAGASSTTSDAPSIAPAEAPAAN